jgi:signal transduction histidine kinase
MHKLLQRQLARHLSLASRDAAPEAWRLLLAAVDEAYEQADTDRLLLERSLELTSQELIQRNQELWQDIAERKRAEALLAGQQRVLERIATGGPLTEVLDLLCRVAEEQADGLRGAVCLLDQRATTLHLVAAPSLPDAFKRAAASGLRVGPEAGSCGTAVFRAQPVYVADIASDPLWTAQRELVLPYGLRACWSMPILATKGKTLGAMALYSPEPKAPSPSHVRLLELSAHLAGIAVERAEAEASLRRQAADLARSNTELEQFAYAASHDLQEPLRMVTSYLQLVAKRYRDALDAEAQEFIGHAVNGAGRMQQLINGLLAYSRVGSCSRPFEPTDLTEVVRRTLEDLQVAIRESGAEVRCNGLPTVLGDATQLSQLFQNLIGNAIKFHTLNAPARIAITAERRGREWLLTVRDNGIGIDPQHIERIFLIFRRLHTQAEYPGTGIGLAICKKIMDRHGGTIWVESRVGEGAAFSFTLPSAEARLAAEAAEAASSDDAIQRPGTEEGGSPRQAPSHDDDATDPVRP